MTTSHDVSLKHLCKWTTVIKRTRETSALVQGRRVHVHVYVHVYVHVWYIVKYKVLKTLKSTGKTFSEVCGQNYSLNTGQIPLMSSCDQHSYDPRECRSMP